MDKVVSGTFVAVCVVLGTIIVLALIGSTIDSIGDWYVEHERCLKHAANGYEISRCR